MPGKTFGVRRKFGKAGEFEVADVSLSVARQRGLQLSQLSRNTAYVVVDVNTDRVYSTFLNGKDVS